MTRNVLFAAILFITVIPAASAQDADWVRRYDCRLRNGAIVVDGVGDEIAWQTAPEVGEFTRFQLKGDRQVTRRTTAKMLWDNENLYFLIAVEDPDIWSTMTERDVQCLCLEETIEIFIDPDGDGLDYAEIHINCLNTINDICIPRKSMRNPDGSALDWKVLYAWTLEGMQRGVMNHGTVNNSDDRDIGTVFEFAMPWKGFGKVAGTANIPPKPGDVWRINVNRYERPRGGPDAEKNIELSGWAPLDLQSYHVPERFGYVRFVDDF